MKTLRTFIAVLAITSISTAAIAQGGLLDKAKDAAKKKSDKAKEAKDAKAAKASAKTGKGNDKMAVKSSGVSQTTTTTNQAGGAATTTPTK